MVGKARALVFVLASLASLAQAPAHAATVGDANWIQFHYSADHQGVNPLETTLDPTTVAGLHQAWAGHTDDAIGLSSAAVSGGVAYIGSHDGRLYAFDAVTGTTLWKTQSLSMRESSPAVWNRTVYSLALGGVLTASDTVTGHSKWVAHTSATISPITIANGEIFLAGASVEAYDASNGQLLWATPLPEFSVAGATAYQGRLFAVGGDYVYSLDANTGAMIWQKRLEAFQLSTPAVAGGMVYVGDSSLGNVYALRAGTGKLAWQFDTQSGLPDSSPAVVGGVVYIGDYSHDCVWALDATTGALKWRSHGGGSQGSVSYADGVVYAASYWGDAVFAFDANTGVTLWSSPLGTHSMSTPVVVNGMLYVGAEDGNLHAFSL